MSYHVECTNIILQIIELKFTSPRTYAKIVRMLSSFIFMQFYFAIFLNSLKRSINLSFLPKKLVYSYLSRKPFTE